MKPHYRFSLRQSETIFYAVDGQAVTTRNTAASQQPFYFHNGLMEWDKIGMIDKRSSTLYGFFRNYTEANLRFTDIPGLILRYIWFTQGRKAIPKLYIETLNSTTQNYEFDYYVDLSLTTAVRERDYIGVKVAEAGVAAYVKNREDVEYEFDVSAANGAKTVTLQPMRVYGKVTFWTAWPNPSASNNLALQISGTTTGYKIYSNYVSKDLVPVADIPGNEPVSFPDPTQNSNVSGQNFEMLNNVTGLPTNSNNYLFKANVGLKNITIKIANIAYYIENTSGGGLPGHYSGSLYKVGVGGAPLTLIQARTSINVADGGSYNGSFSFDTAKFDMAAGESLIMTFSFNVPGGSVNAHKYLIRKDTPIVASFEHYTSSFNVTGLPWMKVFELLVNRVTDGTGSVKSDLFSLGKTYAEYFDLNPKYLLMLSGESVRGIANPKMKISLKQFQKASFVMAGAGFGVEGSRCVLEPIKYFFNPSASKMIADLGEVADLNITDATDFLYNEIHIGYPEKKYDDINGRDETNTTFKYLLPNLSTKNAFNMVSDVRADGYGIYYTWAQYNLFDKKDSESDNDLFALQVTPAQTAALYPGNIVSNPYVNGVLEGTRLINPGLTPGRCARRLGPFIRSWFFNQDLEYMQFQIGDRNVSLESRFAAEFVTERGNVQFNGMGDRIFMPFLFNASLDSPTNYNKLWQATRNGWFKFTFMGVEYAGFPMESANREAIAKLQDWKFLAVPTSNPAQWI